MKIDSKNLPELKLFLKKCNAKIKIINKVTETYMPRVNVKRLDIRHKAIKIVPAGYIFLFVNQAERLNHKKKLQIFKKLGIDLIYDLPPIIISLL